jgi:hypothetical protein
MLEQFIMMNQDFIGKLRNLATRTSKSDPVLQKAVKLQIDGYIAWNEAVEMILAKMEN